MHDNAELSCVRCIECARSTVACGHDAAYFLEPLRFKRGDLCPLNSIHTPGASQCPLARHRRDGASLTRLCGCVDWEPDGLCSRVHARAFGGAAHTVWQQANDLARVWVYFQHRRKRRAVLPNINGLKGSSRGCYPACDPLGIADFHPGRRILRREFTV